MVKFNENNGGDRIMGQMQKTNLGGGTNTGEETSQFSVSEENKEKLK